MNKHKIEYVNKSEYHPPTISEDINANVVADVRFRNRTTSGGYVARPSAPANVISGHIPQRGIIKLLQGFKVMMRAAL